MGLQGVKRALQKCPPPFHAARAMQSAGRTLFGPSWLRRQVKQKAAQGGPLQIVIGSSQVFDDGWVPTNVQYLNLLEDRQWQQAFESENRLDAILAEHVWEHLSAADGRAAAARCFRFLRPGGRLRIAVPDGNHPDPDYIEFVRPGGSGPGADDHKMLYTEKTLSEMLHDVGFDVEPLEYYDADGNFRYVPWSPRGGRIVRSKDWTEVKPGGGLMRYSSLIVDALKPECNKQTGESRPSDQLVSGGTAAGHEPSHAEP
jgi:predicted SAM-dependent methyltransferase